MEDVLKQGPGKIIRFQKRLPGHFIVYNEKHANN